jgi:DNA-binding response OmpR family regulator
MRILLAEDEKRIAEDIASVLQASGYVVDIAENGEDAWFKGGTQDYAAAILDLGLPEIDGVTVLSRWRQQGVHLPVLVLTARGSWAERVEGIDAGADDYLAKPFHMEELLARLRALVRRSAGQSAPLISHGPLTLDTRQMRVNIDGRPINLTPLEYRLVSYLLHHRGRVVSQMELTEHIYAQDFERDSNAIEVLVGRVRRKLKIDLIETRRGFGYLVPDEAA